MKIAVTGGSGKLGRTVVAGLREAGHDVVNLDVAGTRGPGFVRIDLTNYGETIDALFGENDPSAGADQATRPAFDALVHLAAIPAPGILSDVATFHNLLALTPGPSRISRFRSVRPRLVFAWYLQTVTRAESAGLGPRQDLLRTGSVPAGPWHDLR